MVLKGIKLSLIRRLRGITISDSSEPSGSVHMQEYITTDSGIETCTTTQVRVILASLHPFPPPPLTNLAQPHPSLLTSPHHQGGSSSSWTLTAIQENILGHAILYSKGVRRSVVYLTQGLQIALISSHIHIYKYEYQIPIPIQHVHTEHLNTQRKNTGLHNQIYR